MVSVFFYIYSHFIFYICREVHVFLMCMNILPHFNTMVANYSVCQYSEMLISKRDVLIKKFTVEDICGKKG